MPQLVLQLLGSFQATLDGRPLTGFESNKVRALLAYLTVEADRPHSRDELVGLLWPDQPDATARANLRQALANLRNAIGDRTSEAPFLFTISDSVQFNRADRCSIDVIIFTELIAACRAHAHRRLETCRACAQRLQQAVELYRGDLLAQFVQSGSEAFEEWALIKRERLHREALDALYALAEHHDRRSEYDHMRHYASRQLELDPWREEAHRQLMRALALSGQRSAALAQYETCRRILDKELGAEPSQETVSLQIQIKADRLTRADQHHNLPNVLTSLIGRKRELAEIERLLETPTCHLLTLTGSGGIGKTRLAVQAAWEGVALFQDGVWLIEFAPLSDAALVPHAVASTLGLLETSGRSLVAALIDVLSEKQRLLIFDNCEHLIEACAQLAAALLTACPHLCILVTSREPLRIPGEISFRVPSLSIPETQHLPMLQELMHYEAVQLFVERGRAVVPNYTLIDDNAAAITHICQRLDGIPLAIELAAACLKTLRAEEIAARLDNRFRLLTGGARTALPRQQTLRALIDWSYGLLAENERLLLRRLAVFVGSWTLEAAEQACSGESIDSDEMLDLLAQLVNKSLVSVMEQAQNRETRYRMLETIRQYAREKLIESGEGNAIRDRHLDYYRRVVEKAEPELFGPKELIWLAWLEDEWGNLRAAVEWSLEMRAAAGLELVNCLGYFLTEHFYMGDVENWLSQLMTHPQNSERSGARARGLLFWAWYAATGYKHSGAVSFMLEDALAIYRELGDKNGLAHGYSLQADFSTDPQNKSRLYEQALELFRETNDIAWVANTLRYLGWSLNVREYAYKLACLEESLSLSRELGYVTVIIEASKQLGALELRQGHFEAASQRLEEAFSMWQAHAADLGDSIVLSYDLGDLAFYEGDYELAQKHYEDALAWAKQKGLPDSVGWAQARLGYALLRRGQVQAAYLQFRQALLHSSTAGNPVVIDFIHEGSIYTLEGLASLAVTQAEYKKAVRLFAWADENRKSQDIPRVPIEQAAVDRDLAIIHSQLDKAAFEQAYQTGYTMTLKQAVEYALGEKA